jgi:primary-amine oxidase
VKARLGIVFLIVLLVSGLTGCTTCCTRFTAQPAGLAGNEVVQEFPSREAMQTAWRVRWAVGPGKGLYITGAWFKRSPSEPWMRVLWDARLSEIFVPYHSGSPRYYDLGGFNFDVEDANENDAGCCGRLLGASPRRIVWEVRDRGVLWKNDQQVRRGEELVLWATIDAANYNYIVHYGFRDDGSVAFRVAGTAENLPGRRWESHMHNGLWRIDIDLNGHPNDSALITRHIESVTGPTATDSDTPFNGGIEGAGNWNDLQFTQLRVRDTQRQNAQGKNIAYDLRPVRFGTPRHQEDFARHDFWVSRYRSTELYYPMITSYVSNNESVTNTDVVLWHISPLHHMPRSEDGNDANGWNGVALTMWGGFDLRPRDLFDGTPLHP